MKMVLETAGQVPVSQGHKGRGKWGQSLFSLRMTPLIGLYDYFLFQTFGGLEKIA